MRWPVTRPALALAILTLCAAACAAPDEPLLGSFFAASRLRDRAALRPFSTVFFDPSQQGIVRTFSIAAVSATRMVDGAPTKEVTVVAPVVAPDGRTKPTRLIVTLRKADEDVAGYPWMVVDVRDEAGARWAERL